MKEGVYTFVDCSKSKYYRGGGSYLYLIPATPRRRQHIRRENTVEFTTLYHNILCPPVSTTEGHQVLHQNRISAISLIVCSDSISAAITSRIAKISVPVLPTRSIPSAVSRVIMKKKSVSVVWEILGLTDASLTCPVTVN